MRQYQEVISSHEDVSHKAIRQKYHRAAGLFALDVWEHEAMVIDETKVRIDGEWRIVWAAIDMERWEIVALWVTTDQSSLVS